jgi:hypothetical protein
MVAMSAVLKSLVERIAKDPGFRNAFIAKPQEILNNQLISRSERKALIRARRRLLLAGPGRDLDLIGFEWP